MIKYAKIGTHPEIVVFRYNYKLIIGQRVLFRFQNDSKYKFGTVTGKNEFIVYIEED